MNRPLAVPTSSGRWQSVYHDKELGKTRHLGVFDTKEEALGADPDDPKLRAPQVRVRKTVSGRFEARATINGKRKHLGTYDTYEQAAAVELPEDKILDKGDEQP